MAFRDSEMSEYSEKAWTLPWNCLDTALTLIQWCSEYMEQIGEVNKQGDGREKEIFDLKILKVARS